MNKARGDSVAADFEKIKKEDCRAIARRLGLELNRQDKAKCFLHAGDKTPSLQIYGDGWKCFGCGEHGDAVDLVAKYRGVSTVEAAEWIMREMNIREPTRKNDYGKPEREHIYPGGQVKKIMYRRGDGSKYYHLLHHDGEPVPGLSKGVAWSYNAGRGGKRSAVAGSDGYVRPGGPLVKDVPRPKRKD